MEPERCPGATNGSDDDGTVYSPQTAIAAVRAALEAICTASSRTCPSRGKFATSWSRQDGQDRTTCSPTPAG